MQKWLGLILSFYLLLGAVLPCTLFDQCATTTQTSKSSEKKDCDSCPPFSTCSTHHGFTHQPLTAILEPAPFCLVLTYGDYHVASAQGYQSTPFQPPRIG